jgi:leucyl-tRNA synthetase
MIYINEANQWENLPADVAKPFIKLLSPFAPHLAEEIWEQMGSNESIAYEPWPELVEEHLKSDTVEIPVQVNGKVRANITVPADNVKDKEFVLALAKEQENIQRYLDGSEIVKEIFVPGRIVNLVVK